MNATKASILLFGLASIPFGPSKQWSVMAIAATAVVDYVKGLERLPT